jgi:hypothetical protein
VLLPSAPPIERVRWQRQVQYARYLGCHSAGTTRFLLRDVFDEDISLLVQRVHCNVCARDNVRCSLLG